MAKTPPQWDPKLVIFHEASVADVRKMNAQSNDAKTGGGARDLRFNFDEFDGVFREMLPTSRMVKLSRKGVRTDEPVHYGNATFLPNNGKEIQSEIGWFTPTDSRDWEGRIPRVHLIPALSVPPEKGKGVPMLLIMQATDGSIFLKYAYENSLAGWHPALVNVLERSLRAKRGNTAATGYIDLKDHREHVHVTRRR